MDRKNQVGHIYMYIVAKLIYKIMLLNDKLKFAPRTHTDTHIHTHARTHTAQHNLTIFIGNNFD